VRDILIHSNFAAETVMLLTTLSIADHCGVWIERPVFANLSPQAEVTHRMVAEGVRWPRIKTNSVVQGMNLMPS